MVSDDGGRSRQDPLYQGNPQTIEELKTAITAKIRAIPKEECVKVIDNLVRRVQVCLQRNGGLLEHILESHKLTKN